MPEYLVRLVQVHESFRKAELLALAELAGVELDILKYSEDVSLFMLLFPPTSRVISSKRLPELFKSLLATQMMSPVTYRRSRRFA
jgi:tRNA G10  N-methylase Trm11